jgi:hypothetical protein
MSFEKRLKLAAVLFTVLWTAGMWWMHAPLDTHALAVLGVVSVITGVLWYWLYGKWARWYFGVR